MLSLTKGGKFMSVTGAELYRAGSLPWYLSGGAPTPLAAYRAIGAASLAASKVNLPNPGTYDAFAGVNPTHASATGWGFDGTQYLRTGIVPVAGANAILVRFSDVPSTPASRMVAGEYGASDRRLFIEPNYTGGKVWYCGGNTSQQISPGLLAGVLGIAGTTCYRNGVAESGSVANLAANAIELYIGAGNNSGSAAWYFQGNVQAFVVWNTSTNHAIWMPAVSAAMAALTG